MITKGPSVPSFFTSDGNEYRTLELAQRAELFQLLNPKLAFTEEQTATVCTTVYDNRTAICEILRASGRRPRKSKGNGATRKRKAATEAAK